MITSRLLLATVLTLALGACGSSSPGPTRTTPAPVGAGASASARAGGVSSSSAAPSASASFTPGTSGGGSSAAAFRVLVSKQRVQVPPPAVAGDNYDITATIQGCEKAGVWIYSGTWRIVSRSVNDGNVNDNTGGVLDLTGGQQPDGAHLTLSFVSTRADNAKLPASVRDGQGQFLLSGGGSAPAVQLQAFRGTGDPLPPVALTVAAETPQCG